MTFNRKTLSILALGGLLSVAVPAVANSEEGPRNRDGREALHEETYKGSGSETLPPPPMSSGNIDYNAPNPEEELTGNRSSQ